MKYRFIVFFLGLLMAACTHTSPTKPVQPPTEAAAPEAPDSLRFCMTIAPTNQVPTNKKAVGIPPIYWPQNYTLKIGFPFGGTAAQIAFAKDAISTWDSLTNLTATYPAHGPYDIRIGFDPAQGSYSYIGKDAQNVIQANRTVNIGWGWTSTATIGGKMVYTDGVARHEIGHAWGAAHEQCNPNSPICWNKNNVYIDLGGSPNFWSHSMVDQNVFYICIGSQNTPRDDKSIMMYNIIARWTCDNKAISGGQFLSATDRSFWTSVYQGTVQPPPPPTTSVTLTAAQVQLLMANAISVRDVTAKAAVDAQAALNTALAAKSTAANNYNAVKTALGQ